MFAVPFLIALGFLMLALLSSALLKKFERLTSAAILLGTCAAFFLGAAMLAERTYAGRFTFQSPWCLAFLLIPMLLLALRLFWPNAFIQRLAYPLTGFLPSTLTLGALFNRFLPLFLGVAGLTLCIIALARPVALSSLKLPPTPGIDIMMIIDASASMANNDFFPNRLVAAKQNAAKFIKKRFNDRIGLVIFAQDATLAAPLTLDHEAVQDLVESIYIGIVNPYRTAIGDALGVASSHLKDSTAKSKIILLLTDGSNNAGTLDPLLAAKAAAAYGIKVYTIATASTPDDSIFSSVQDEIDEGLLFNMAKETGGAFYRAKNEIELQKIYNQINELEKTDFTQAVRVSQNDIYRPFLLAGLGLFLLGWLLRKLVFIRVP